MNDGIIFSTRQIVQELGLGVGDGKIRDIKNIRCV